MRYEVAEVCSGFTRKVVFGNALLLSVVVLRTNFDSVHERCEHPVNYLSCGPINCNYKFLSESELLYKIQVLEV